MVINHLLTGMIHPPSVESQMMDIWSNHFHDQKPQFLVAEEGKFSEISGTSITN